MSFKRILQPVELSTGQTLTSDMIGIGFQYDGVGSKNPNIENTLLAASIEGTNGDYRTLSILTVWLGKHIQYVNADRLIKIISELSDEKVKTFWSAVAQWQKTDRRFLKLIKYKKRIDLLPTGTDFQIKRKGEDPRFQYTCLRVPAGTLRDRESDVLDPKHLAAKHTIYRYRVMMGPSYRADMWALLQMNPKLSASELARKSYGSFATAWKVTKDREVAKVAA